MIFDCVCRGAAYCTLFVIILLNRSRSEAMMEYKGYTAKVEFDEKAEIFHGAQKNLSLGEAFR